MTFALAGLVVVAVVYPAGALLAEATATPFKNSVRVPPVISMIV